MTFASTYGVKNIGTALKHGWHLSTFNKVKLKSDLKEEKLDKKRNVRYFFSSFE